MSTDSLQLFKIPKDLEIVKILETEAITDFRKSQKEWVQYRKFIKKSSDMEWAYKEGFRKQKYITSALSTWTIIIKHCLLVLFVLSCVSSSAW